MTTKIIKNHAKFADLKEKQMDKIITVSVFKVKFY